MALFAYNAIKKCLQEFAHTQLNLSDAVMQDHMDKRGGGSVTALLLT